MKLQEALSVFLLPFVLAQDGAQVPITALPLGPLHSVPLTSVYAISDTQHTSLSASSTTTPPATQTVTVPPNTPSIFTLIPVPSDSPVLPSYPETDPLDPLPVGSLAIPDFGPAWSAAWAKAKPKEKVSVVTGVGWQGGVCIGSIAPIEPIDGRGWPGLCLEDSPLGVRLADYVTAFPAGINAAASFNRHLMRRRGLYIGREHVGKGVNIALGPMMNMVRVPQAGRNWESFGADPFLAGEAAYETILGMQEGGVIACAKHYVGNEQENKRLMSSSNIDDRTLHEIYTHPFLKSVMAGVGSVMCSYNGLNGTFACENDKVLNDILKREYGFQSFITSDWMAQHASMAANAGLDMTMPGDITFGSGTSYWGANLTAFVSNGTISES
ncbi:unnamed protein product [Cyclocybe aegerita]|uniref:beta-glucosidase n=1 Tax=Cyclocybe aegerita TaxID=1973307 RepID=A0A8S0W623_CYCAE|nr:unnamed protein product [Cyclocybe aegerita]